MNLLVLIKNWFVTPGWSTSWMALANMAERISRSVNTFCNNNKTTIKLLVFCWVNRCLHHIIVENVSISLTQSVSTIDFHWELLILLGGSGSWILNSYYSAGFCDSKYGFTIGTKMLFSVSESHCIAKHRVDTHQKLTEYFQSI